jgi:hypothetical protein
MFEIVCKFDVPADSPLRDAGHALEALRPYAEWLGTRDPALKRWWLGAESLEAALQYEAFAEGQNGHVAAKAVMTAEYKNSRAPVVYLWNGQDDSKTGASLVVSVTESCFPSKIELSLSGSPTNPRPGLGDYRTVAEFVAKLARDTDALCCFVYRRTAYFRRMPFKDRPGVGWMLYLPRVFTPAELPEARALVPVMRGKTAIGTIIVSVIDGVFDARNDEHMKVAREIETRLVSNDWLPTWEQMVRST